MKSASHPDVPRPSDDELVQHALNVMRAIEICGASPALTDAGCLAADLHAYLRKQAQPAVAPRTVSLPFPILDVELEALQRFDECARDGEGYDVDKDMMKRLAKIGVVRRATGSYYEHTSFGLAVLNGDFGSLQRNMKHAQPTTGPKT